MDSLLQKSVDKVTNVSVHFQRYLLYQIDWNNRLIAIKGARGSGKTTLLLQYLALKADKHAKSLYVAMDDLYFTDHLLYDLAGEFTKIGGSYLLIDEVHKYPNWSREIKLIYDDYPDLNVVFTSSSILDIYRGESDLSRRAISYELKELSLREFIALDYNIHFDTYSLSDIVSHSKDIIPVILNKIKPIAAFREYIKYGAYPYFIEGKDNYKQRLLHTLNLIIEIDMMATSSLNYENLVKIKKLLKTIASSVPFTPNISKLSKKMGMSRPTLIHALHLLEKARLIHQLNKATKGIGQLTKPEKIYLNNSNLLSVLTHSNWSIGTVRETFLANQLTGILPLHLGDKADFFVDNKYHFEVGGKGKTQRQIQSLENAFLVKDDIEYSVDNTIPLWLFGFVY